MYPQGGLGQVFELFVSSRLESGTNNMYSNEEPESRSDDVSPFPMVSCAQVHVRKFQERLPTGWACLIQIPPRCVYWVLYASRLVHRTPPKEHERPRARLWTPLFSGTTHLCPRPKPF